MGIVESIDQQLRQFGQRLSAFESLLQKGISVKLPQEENDLLTVQQVAKLLNRSEDTVYRLTSQKKIPHTKPSGILIFFKSEILEWLKEHRVKTIDEIDNDADENFSAVNKKKKAA